MIKYVPLQAQGPEFQPQYHKNKKEKSSFNYYMHPFLDKGKVGGISERNR
jgi:hypothetical protein